MKSIVLLLLAALPVHARTGEPPASLEALEAERTRLLDGIHRVLPEPGMMLASHSRDGLQFHAELGPIMRLLETAGFKPKFAEANLRFERTFGSGVTPHIPACQRGSGDDWGAIRIHFYKNEWFGHGQIHQLVCTPSDGRLDTQTLSEFNSMEELKTKLGAVNAVVENMTRIFPSSSIIPQEGKP